MQTGAALQTKKEPATCDTAGMLKSAAKKQPRSLSGLVKGFESPADPHSSQQIYYREAPISMALEVRSIQSQIRVSARLREYEMKTSCGRGNCWSSGAAGIR